MSRSRRDKTHRVNKKLQLVIDTRGKTSAHACISARFLRIQESLSEKRKVRFSEDTKNSLVYFRERKIMY